MIISSVRLYPNGKPITSGKVGENAVFSSSLVQQCNNGQELNLGSCCSAKLEMTIWNPGGNLKWAAGDIIEYMEHDGSGNLRYRNLFRLDRPSRPSANTIKIVGYDKMVLLDKDLTNWLNELTGWPFTLRNFILMVCEQCGVECTIPEDILNADFFVAPYKEEGTTGRQILKWLGELACVFWRYDYRKGIIPDWYDTINGYDLKPSGDRFYFEGGLSYDDYEVAPIEAVQMWQTVEIEDYVEGGTYSDTFLWPEADTGANSYILKNNPYIQDASGYGAVGVIENIMAKIAATECLKGYTPCKVKIPAEMQLPYPGYAIKVTDPNGKTFSTVVMSQSRNGQKVTLECCGSPRREQGTASGSGNAGNYAGGTPSTTKITRTEILQILKGGGEIDGLYVRNGQLLVNPSAIAGDLLKMLEKDGVVQIKSSGDLSIDAEGAISIAGKTVAWKDNGDGSFTLTGT